MFNTISKRCLLCLRLVSRGASLLWSGFFRGGVDRDCVCAPHSCSSATVVAPRKHSERASDGASPCCCDTPACVLRRLLCGAPSRVWVPVPQDDGGNVTSKLVPLRSSQEAFSARCVSCVNKTQRVHTNLIKRPMSAASPSAQSVPLNLSRISQISSSHSLT